MTTATATGSAAVPRAAPSRRSAGSTAPCSASSCAACCATAAPSSSRSSCPSCSSCSSAPARTTRYRAPAHGNSGAGVMIIMALYGAMLSTTAGGAMVSGERSQGWSRQLRLTPLTPTAYIAVKVLVAMLLGGAVHRRRVCRGVADAVRGGPPPVVWRRRCIAWVGSLVFAAFGVFMGYLLPSDNVMQILGPGLALLAFLGGLFMPLDQMGPAFRAIAKFTPMYGLSQLAHAPLTGETPRMGRRRERARLAGVFAGGAAWRFRRDTARV